MTNLVRLRWSKAEKRVFFGEQSSRSNSTGFFSILTALISVEVNEWGTSAGLTYHENNEEDPYITVPDIDNDELEDFMFRPTDDVILSAVVEDEMSHLDVCILAEEDDAELYVHHEYQLPVFPLCVAWVPPNVAAVGTFQPEIELWDLNIVESAKPDGMLQGHTDAVLGLATHPQTPQMLASASADATVRLWDISTQQTVLTMEHHQGAKVQSVAWSPSNSSVEYQGLLASGGFDQRVFVLDVRQSDAATHIQLDADVEAIRWHLAESDSGGAPALYISTETGDVICWDLTAGKRRWTLSAHLGAPCSSFSLFTPAVNGAPTLLATAAPSTQSPLKLWAIDPARGAIPSCIYQKTADFGRLNSVAFAPQRPFHLAVGGHSKHPEVFNTLTLAEVQALYHNVPGINIPTISGKFKAMRRDDDDSEEEADGDFGGMDTDDAPARRAAPAGRGKKSAAASKYISRPALGASRKKRR